MGAISHPQRGQALRQRAEGQPGHPRRQRRDRRRRVHRHRRPVGLRQEHAAAHGGRARRDLRRRNRHRRPRGQRHRAGRARHRDGVPELRAVPAHERVRQHGLRPEDRQGAGGRDQGSASTRRRRSCSSAPYLARKPRELSGGQRQRVAMGRAIVRQPQVFLFDEPLSNLDAKLRAQTRLEIQKLHRELGVTSLFVTHDQVEAMTLGATPDRDERRPHGADRHARRGVRAAGHHVRRRLHRLAADEPAARPCRRRDASRSTAPRCRCRRPRRAPAS